MDRFKKTGLMEGGGSENEGKTVLTSGHGNTRLPFGLCERYGISVGKDWTPRDAWDALNDEKGITPESTYASLEERPVDEGGKTGDFMPARTIEEAEQVAREKIGATCNYKGVALEVANQINVALLRGVAVCPGIKEQLQYVGSGQKRNVAYKEELFNYFLGKMRKEFPYLPEIEVRKRAKHLASKMAGRIDSITYAYNVNAVLGEDDQLNEIHRRYDGIFVNDVWGKNADRFKQELNIDVEERYHPMGCNTIVSVFDHEVAHAIADVKGLGKNSEIRRIYFLLSREEITKGLSSYAATNIFEFIAEGWAEYKNNPRPRKIATRIGELIDKIK